MTRVGYRTSRTVRAGSGTLEDDRAAVREAAAAGEPIAILVKSWEPPLGDLIDFATDLRVAAGPTAPIAVIPTAPDKGAPPRAEDLETWRDRLALVGDPWLTVREARP